MPKIHATSSPSRYTSTAPPSKAKSSEVDDLEKYQMYEDKEISMDLGADLRKADDVESTPKRLKLWLMMS
jgi:hypothetical protein